MMYTASMRPEPEHRVCTARGCSSHGAGKRTYTLIHRRQAMPQTDAGERSRWGSCHSPAHLDPRQASTASTQRTRCRWAPTIRSTSRLPVSPGSWSTTWRLHLRIKWQPRPAYLQFLVFFLRWRFKEEGKGARKTWQQLCRCAAGGGDRWRGAG